MREPLQSPNGFSTARCGARRMRAGSSDRRTRRRLCWRCTRHGSPSHWLTGPPSRRWSCGRWGTASARTTGTVDRPGTVQ
eukprot:4787743-Pyramimonas_sp.AAC.1